MFGFRPIRMDRAAALGGPVFDRGNVGRCCVAVEFIEEPFEVAIKDGNAILSWPDGTRRSIPLRVFRIEHHRAGEALAKHDAGKAVVVPLKGRRR